MFDAARRRLSDLLRRLRRLERRELVAGRRWLENTQNLLHLSVLLAVPLLIAVVTTLSNAIAGLSFLLFPPLAAGAYTLFSDPEGRYASVRTFVGGLTLGAFCGWLAMTVSATYVYRTSPGGLEARAGAAALAIFLTGAATWALDLEHPSAYSTALLVLLTGEIDVAFLAVPFESALAYTAGVAVSTSIIGAAFHVWRTEFYERRAQLLYGTTRGDDHVLVPMRGETEATTALFGASLAAAHEAGKVVLLDVVDDDRVAEAERAILHGEGVDRSAEEIEAVMGGEARGERPDDGSRGGPADGGDRSTVVDDDSSALTDDGSGAPDDDGAGTSNGDAAGTAVGDVEESAEYADRPVVESVEDEAARRAAAEAAVRLERRAERLRTRVGVPCEVVVASGDPGRTAIRAARTANCDLIVTPYESERGHLSGVVRTIFRGPIDAIAFRSTGEGESRTEEWRRVLVAVARPGDSAHAMIDFATRLAGRTGRVSVCTCIKREVERRPAESRLADLVETVEGRVETRVARSSIEDFIGANADAYDLVVLGSSGDRSTASRFVSPPTFQRLRDVDCDVAVVDRGEP